MSVENLEAGSGSGAAAPTADIATDTGVEATGEITSLSELAQALEDEDEGAGGNAGDASAPTGAEANVASADESDTDTSAAADTTTKPDPDTAAPPPDDAEAKAKAAEEAKANEEAAGGHPAFQKRIDQLVAQREEAREASTTKETELATVRQELETAKQRIQTTEQQAQQTAAVNAGISPLLLSTSVEELTAKRDELLNTRQWLQNNPDGATLGNDELDSDQIAAWLASTEHELFVSLPEAQQLLPLRQQAEQYATTVYPDYFGKDAAVSGQQVISGLLQQTPGLARMENLPMIVGDMLAGAAMRQLGVRPAADGKGFVGKDGKSVWTPKAGGSAEAKTIVAAALKEEAAAALATGGAPAGGTAVGGASTGANARAGGSSSQMDAFVENPTEESLAKALAG